MAKAAMSAAIVLIMVSFLACCIVPMLRRQCLRAMDRQTDIMMGLQGARMVNVLANEQMRRMSSEYGEKRDSGIKGKVSEWKGTRQGGL